MKFLKKSLLLLALAGAFFTGFSQTSQPSKVHDIFLEYLKTKLPLTEQEASQMRPLVIRYFNESRKIPRQFPDPLIRQQQKIDLKIRYRNKFIPLIGDDRSNRFFSEETLFRKKVSEALKQRKKV